MQTSTVFLREPVPHLGAWVWLVELNTSRGFNGIRRELPARSIQLLNRESDHLHCVQELRPGHLPGVLLFVGRRYVEHRGEDFESAFVDLELLRLDLLLFFHTGGRISACVLLR